MTWRTLSPSLLGSISGLSCCLAACQVHEFVRSGLPLLFAIAGRLEIACCVSTASNDLRLRQVCADLESQEFMVGKHQTCLI